MSERDGDIAPVRKALVAEVAAVIRKHVRMEWHGHDHADINFRSTVDAAEEIVAQFERALSPSAEGQS